MILAHPDQARIYCESEMSAPEIHEIAVRIRKCDSHFGQVVIEGGLATHLAKRVAAMAAES